MIHKKIEQFSMKAHDPYTPFLGNSMETGEELLGVTDWIPAKVPESVYKTLLREGYIEDPFLDQNSLKCEWIPNRWWEYRAHFPLQRNGGRHYRLRIDHLDYTAHLWFNHQPLGDSTNLFVPFCKDVTPYIQEDNELSVLIEHAPTEHGQIGYTSRTHTQKPRFNYKWDWCMRLVSIGIDSPVYIEEFGDTSIESLRAERTFADDNSCTLSGEVELYGFEDSEQQLLLELSLHGDTVAKQELTVPVSCGCHHAFPFSMDIPSAQLWWPNGHGEQPLYQLRVTTRNARGECSDEKSYSIGLRTIRHLPSIGGARDAFPYRMQINGKDIYLKGVNYLPPEMQQADITRDRLRQVIQNIADANCNLIRVWGGAYIGSEDLYDICDELGILIWQEFTQSSSGIDNVPSKDPYFMAQLAETAKAAVPRIRTHPSLALYSGGNELTDFDGVPATFEDENVGMLQKIVSENDSRYMLPTSASGPNEFLDITAPGKNHDVHGPWKYEGTTQHYTIYNQSDSLLHSEFGVDGMANYATMKRFLSPENLAVTSMRNNLVWRHRGELWDTYDRTCRIFGTFPAEALQEFIMCSQYIQAEGLRYALEANRRRAFQNCGSIIWQYNEPCPHVSGTNLEDYYGEKKLAYYFVRNAFRPLTASLRYDKLLFTSGENVPLQVTVLNDSEAFHGELSVTAKTEEGQILYQQDIPVSVPENQNMALEPFTVTIPDTRALSVTLSLTGNGPAVVSHYILFVTGADQIADKKIAVREYLSYMETV